MSTLLLIFIIYIVGFIVLPKIFRWKPIDDILWDYDWEVPDDAVFFVGLLWPFSTPIIICVLLYHFLIVPIKNWW